MLSSKQYQFFLFNCLRIINILQIKNKKLEKYATSKNIIEEVFFFLQLTLYLMVTVNYLLLNFNYSLFTVKLPCYLLTVNTLNHFSPLSLLNFTPLYSILINFTGLYTTLLCFFQLTSLLSTLLHSPPHNSTFINFTLLYST